MSLYVNAALQRTRCSHGSFDRPRCLRSYSWKTFHHFTILRNTRAENRRFILAATDCGPRLCTRDYRCVPLSRVTIRAGNTGHIPGNAASYPCSLPFSTTATNGSTLNLTDQSEEVKGVTTTKLFKYSPSVPDHDSRSSSKSSLLSLQKEHPAVTTLSNNPQDRDQWVNHFFQEERDTQEDVREELYDSPSRKLPFRFEAHLHELATLISRKSDHQHIQDTFRHAIDEKDRLLQEYGTTLEGWLQRSWGSSKSTAVMHLLLGSIMTSPDLLLHILQNLSRVHRDFEVRSLCLSFTGRLHRKALAQDSALMARFDDQLSKLRSPARWPSHNINRQQLSLLLWRLDADAARKLIDTFLDRYQKPSVPARIFLATYCARHRLPLLASKILMGLPPGMLQTPGPAILRCCALVLRYDTVSDGPQGTNFVILPRLLERGLTPDNLLYARIIERALESGYPNVAWDIFHHIQTIDINITAWTYVFLLRDAFNRNNLTGVEEIMGLIQSDILMFTNLHLLLYSMNMVRRIFHNEKRLTTAESFSHILALYDRVFSRNPLSKLGILPQLNPSTSTVVGAPIGYKQELIEPDAYSLSFTIWAYVLCHRSGKHAAPLWRRIQQLVREGDAVILESMRHDLIYNAFIWLNLRNKESMTVALEVFQYMMENQFCMPTDRTWSIMICGLLRHNQYAQARHMYGLMKQCNLSMGDIRQEYWRRQWSFEYFEEHLDEILDEAMMPDGTETGRLEAMRDSASAREMTDALVLDPRDSGVA